AGPPRPHRAVRLRRAARPRRAARFPRPPRPPRSERGRRRRRSVASWRAPPLRRRRLADELDFHVGDRLAADLSLAVLEQDGPVVHEADHVAGRAGLAARQHAGGLDHPPVALPPPEPPARTPPPGRPPPPCP